MRAASMERWGDCKCDGRSQKSDGRSQKSDCRSVAWDADHRTELGTHRNWFQKLLPQRAQRNTEEAVVNTSSVANVYYFVGILAGMASSSGERDDLLTAGLVRRAGRERSAPEVAEDTMLVQAARDGDRAAFGRIYERYAGMVHGVLLAKVPHSEVDDLVQDVFMMALRRLSTLREAGSFGAWLAAIARNLANDYHRRAVPEDLLWDDTPENSVEQVNSVLPTLRKSREGWGSHAGEEDEATAILEAIRSLPDAYRETLILRLVEGMTGPEIAARTGLTHGSVRVNLHRGMQQLRARLSASGDEPERETR